MPDNTVTVRLWLLGIADSPSRLVSVINLGNLVATVLFTVMITEAKVELFPALSIAVAVRVWVVLVKVVVSRGLLMLADEDVANKLPSMNIESSLRPEVT